MSTGKRKQDITVADASGTAKVTIWEENNGPMSESACYELQCFIAREWNSKQYLSLTKDHDGSKILPKEDIGEVVELE